MVVNNEASTMFANFYSSKAMGLEIRFIVKINDSFTQFTVNVVGTCKRGL